MYLAHYLSRQLPANDLGKLTVSLHDGQVDLTPHQVEAALFAFKSPLSNGAILADEVRVGKDQGGISKAVHWKGGGGLRFYTVAPSLLKEDKFGNHIINKEYNGDMLAAAMAKQEGYTYHPNSKIYWKQGQSSEQDYIYTTTQFLTVESLDAIKETMSEGETLLICYSACQNECKKRFSNTTIKKIPQMLLGRCKFDKDDYSLKIINMPQFGTDDEELFDDEPLDANTLDKPEKM